MFVRESTDSMGQALCGSPSRTSAGMRKPAAKARIILRLRVRRPERTSETRLRLPRSGTKSLLVRPCWPIRKGRPKSSRAEHLPNPSLSLERTTISNGLLPSNAFTFAKPNETLQVAHSRLAHFDVGFTRRGSPLLPHHRPGGGHHHRFHCAPIPHLDQRGDQRHLYRPDRSVACQPNQLG